MICTVSPSYFANWEPNPKTDSSLPVMASAISNISSTEVGALSAPAFSSRSLR
ncbi:hypothetical protein FHX50_002082 [Helcobacillus massiliensis]|uniref:Uncharacterized protein n=1 Tax=Helcobacillus massiliensis TaxID=521392 RepID=A0A839R0J0_9MICO|nr:hypothetical protein [Helcobacillus massiliensis]